jgi:hypothetical protein
MFANLLWKELVGRGRRGRIADLAGICENCADEDLSSTLTFIDGKNYEARNQESSRQG